jgi:flagellin-specific chaperone FliS
MLYISRQARKVKLRNSKLNEAEKLTQELSESFRQVIDNEEKELDRLKELLTRL